jgi:hypothetical protein
MNTDGHGYFASSPSVFIRGFHAVFPDGSWFAETALPTLPSINFYYGIDRNWPIGFAASP